MAPHSDAQPLPGESERDMKRRLLAERIRAEAKAKASGRPVPPGAAARQPPGPPPGGAARPATPAGAPSPAGAGARLQPTVPKSAAMKRKPPEPSAPPPSGPPPAKTPRAPRNKKKEDEDSRKLDAMLPMLEAKVAAVEDETFSVSTCAAPLSSEVIDENKELLAGAVRDTERAVRAAAAPARKAREELDRRRKEVAGMEPCLQEGAVEELDKFAARLDAAQAKIDEQKDVRKEHDAAVAAMKLYDELATRLVNVQVDCEKAVTMAEPLAKALEERPDEIPTHMVREAKEALRMSQTALAPTMRLISGRVPNLKGAARNRFLELQVRAEESQALLEKAQGTVDEAQSRATALPILKQAHERLAVIEDILDKMRETEAPFLMGLETIPVDESTDVLGKMDKAAALANAALVDAHKYIALKLVEVGRLSEATAADARAELEKAKQQIDDGVERVRTFQVETGRRKRTNVVSLIKHKIDEAEEVVSRMKEAGAAIRDADADALPEAIEAAAAAEVAAQQAVSIARRELQEKQTDLRPQDASARGEVVKHSSEILKTKARITGLESELNKFRKMVKDADEKMRVGKSLSEVQDLMRDAEADAERVEELAKAFTDEERQPGEEESWGVAEAQAKLTAITKQVEDKLRAAQGLEVKELRGYFGRLQRAQARVDKAREVAQQLGRASAARVVKDATSALQRAEQLVNSLSRPDRSLEQLEKMHAESGQVGKLVSEAQRALDSEHESKLLLESKVDFARLQLRCKALERRGRAAADSLARRMETATLDAVGLALAFLRAAAPDEDGVYRPEVLFETVSGGDSVATQQQLADFLVEHPQEHPAVPAEKAALAARRLAPYGLTSGAFSARLQNYMKVVKDITITVEFGIQSARKIRKLPVGELLEVLSEPRKDDGLGLQRVQARCVVDGAEGWVTTRSVGGTCYLAPSEKPFLSCNLGAVLRKDEEESETVRELKQGEALELVVGPREESLGSGARVRGASCHESAAGWLQVRDQSGAALAKLSKQVFKCKEAIAMTDVADLAACSMVRRVEAGEALELLPEEAEARPGEGGARKKFRACRDGCVGWITTEGSQGTVYMAPAPRHYVCLSAAPVHAGPGADSAVVRVLMQGEAFAAFEEPREVTGAEKVLHYQVKAVTDGREGWVSATSAEEVKPWHSRYIVLRETQLTSSFAASEAAEVVEVVRLLEAGELLDATDPPAEDGSTGQLRVRCAALRDKAVGWATVRDGSTLALRPASASESTPAAAPSAAPSTPPAGSAAPSTPPKGGKGAKRPMPPSQPPPGLPGGKGGKRYKGGKR